MPLAEMEPFAHPIPFTRVGKQTRRSARRLPHPNLEACPTRMGDWVRSCQRHTFVEPPTDGRRHEGSPRPINPTPAMAGRRIDSKVCGFQKGEQRSVRPSYRWLHQPEKPPAGPVELSWRVEGQFSEPVTQHVRPGTCTSCTSAESDATSVKFLHLPFRVLHRCQY